jgi:hypothetical protein
LEIYCNHILDRNIHNVIILRRLLTGVWGTTLRSFFQSLRIEFDMLQSWKTVHSATLGVLLEDSPIL